MITSVGRMRVCISVEIEKLTSMDMGKNVDSIAEEVNGLLVLMTLGMDADSWDDVCKLEE